MEVYVGVTIKACVEVITHSRGYSTLRMSNSLEVRNQALTG